MRLGKIAHQSHQKTHPPHRECAHLLLDARNHYPQIKHHTPPPKWSDKQTHLPDPVTRTRPHPPVSPKGRSGRGPVASKPNSVFSDPSPERDTSLLRAPEPPPTTGAAHPTNRCTHRTPTHCGRGAVSWCSLERR